MRRAELLDQRWKSHLQKPLIHLARAMQSVKGVGFGRRPFHISVAVTRFGCSGGKFKREWYPLVVLASHSQALQTSGSGASSSRACAQETRQRTAFRCPREAMSETGFQVEERDGEIIVMQASPLFIATYYRKSDEPQLILRRRTPTHDHALIARALRAANDTARELGWIV